MIAGALIVDHEVTNVGSDRAQLSKMALAAREAMGKMKLQAYADRGAARLIFWLALSGRKPRGSGLMEGLIEAVHRARERRALAYGRAAPPISDTRFVVALLSSVHAVMPVAGDALLRSTSAEAGKAGRERFLDWVASLLDAHLNAAGS